MGESARRLETVGMIKTLQTKAETWLSKVRLPVSLISPSRRKRRETERGTVVSEGGYIRAWSGVWLSYDYTITDDYSWAFLRPSAWQNLSLSSLSLPPSPFFSRRLWASANSPAAVKHLLTQRGAIRAPRWCCGVQPRISSNRATGCRDSAGADTYYLRHKDFTRLRYKAKGAQCVNKTEGGQNLVK